MPDASDDDADEDDHECARAACGPAACVMMPKSFTCEGSEDRRAKHSKECRQDSTMPLM